MARKAPGANHTRNRLLGALPVAEYARLAEHLERVDLRLKQTVVEADTPIEHVYFPESGVISWVTKTTEENLRVEVATVGREGMIGMPVYLGAEQVPGMAFSQVPGQAMRMPAKAFLAAPSAANHSGAF